MSQIITQNIGCVNLFLRLEFRHIRLMVKLVGQMSAIQINMSKKLKLANRRLSKQFRLTQKQLSAEFAFLNLRLTKGLDLEDYKFRFGIDLQTKFAEDLKRLDDAELIELSDGELKLTRKGMVYSNEVFSIFV